MSPGNCNGSSLLCRNGHDRAVVTKYMGHKNNRYQPMYASVTVSFSGLAVSICFYGTLWQLCFSASPLWIGWIWGTVNPHQYIPGLLGSFHFSEKSALFRGNPSKSQFDGLLITRDLGSACIMVVLFVLAAMAPIFLFQGQLIGWELLQSLDESAVR